MVMNVNNLKIFIKVAERMSITEAANDLYISQPAVSKAIRNLEEQLDIKLFQRDKKIGLIITDVGSEILVLARQMINIENKIIQVASRENKLLGGKVKIGSFPAASTNILPSVISIFKKKYPLVNIELMEGTSNQVKEWVENRLVEIGIVVAPFNEFDYRHLIKDRMIGIISNKSELSEYRINLKEHQKNLIFCKGGHETAISKILRDCNIDFSENITVQNAETLISMVENGVGYGIISEFTLSSVSHNLKTCEITPQIEREIGIVAKSFNELSPAATEFANFIQRITE